MGTAQHSNTLRNIHPAFHCILPVHPFLISILLSSYFSHCQDSVFSFIHKFWYLGFICPVNAIEQLLFFFFIICTMTLPGICIQKLLFPDTEKVWGTPLRKPLAQLENQNVWQGNRRFLLGKEKGLQRNIAVTADRHYWGVLPEGGRDGWPKAVQQEDVVMQGTKPAHFFLTLTLLVQTRDYKELNFCCF